MGERPFGGRPMGGTGPMGERPFGGRPMGGPGRMRPGGPPPPPPRRGWGGYRRGGCLPGCLMYVVGAGGIIALLITGIASLVF